jgi:hypothetical protein
MPIEPAATPRDHRHQATPTGPKIRFFGPGYHPDEVSWIMRRLLFRGLMVSGCVLIGCDRLPPAPVSKDAPKLGPHQATAFALADDLGYVEFVNDPPVEERGSSTPTSIVVYFLDGEAKASSALSPTDVKFRIDQGPKGSRAVELKLEPKTGDPAGGCRYSSGPGPFRIEELRGELTANAGGKPIKVPLVGAR